MSYKGNESAEKKFKGVLNGGFSKRQRMILEQKKGLFYRKMKNNKKKLILNEKKC